MTWISSLGLLIVALIALTEPSVKSIAKAAVDLTCEEGHTQDHTTGTCVALQEENETLDDEEYYESRYEENDYYELDNEDIGNDELYNTTEDDELNEFNQLYVFHK